MEIVNISDVNIYGLKVRTNNSNESVSENAKIMPLWNKMSDDYFPHMLVSSTVYGVYHNYESDVNGEYDLLVGSNKFSDKVEGLDSIKVENGKYLKFKSEGEMPKVCIDLWKDIWNYFNSDECSEERVYSTDFEKYTSTGVEIYISIK